MPKNPTRVLVVSDLHCGSSHALCPPSFETVEGQKIGLNLAQTWLWSQWLSLIKWVRTQNRNNEPIDTLILNGDLIEGIHHRTTEVISNDPADHINCAHHALQPLTELIPTVYVIRGTETHTGPSSEHGLAHRLGAVRPRPHRNHPDGAFDRLDLVLAGVPSRFIHHGVGTRREWTRGTSLNVDLASHRASSLDAGSPVPRVLGLGHLHHYSLYSSDVALAFRTPSWQFHTRHTMKVVPWAENTCGAVLLTYPGDGTLPIVTPWIRRPPP